MLNQVDFPSHLIPRYLNSFWIKDIQPTSNYSRLYPNFWNRDLSEKSLHITVHFYHLTEDGAETIHYFTNDISPAIQHDIDEFLKEKHYELKNEMSVKADYFENSNMEYSVRCQVIEQGLPLIDLTVTAPTESEAATIANNWQKRNQEIYASVMAKLL